MYPPQLAQLVADAIMSERLAIADARRQRRQQRPSRRQHLADRLVRLASRLADEPVLVLPRRDHSAATITRTAPATSRPGRLDGIDRAA